MNHRLFVYGTLLNDHNEFARILKENSDLVGCGHFIGKLYDIGEYPVAIQVSRLNPSKNIWGEIYKLKKPGSLLTLIDEYEGCSHPPAPSDEFIRTELAIFTGRSTLRCWVYLYNHPVSDKIFISSGDYYAYKAGNK